MVANRGTEVIINTRKAPEKVTVKVGGKNVELTPVTSEEAYNNGDAKITVLTLADLDVDTTQIGLKGSPTNVYKSFVPVKDKHNEIIEGINKKEKAEKLIEILFDLKLV